MVSGPDNAKNTHETSFQGNTNTAKAATSPSLGRKVSQLKPSQTPGTKTQNTANKAESIRSADPAAKSLSSDQRRDPVISQTNPDKTAQLTNSVGGNVLATGQKPQEAKQADSAPVNKATLLSDSPQEEDALPSLDDFFSSLVIDPEVPASADATVEVKPEQDSGLDNFLSSLAVSGEISGNSAKKTDPTVISIPISKIQDETEFFRESIDFIVFEVDKNTGTCLEFKLDETNKHKADIIFNKEKGEALVKSSVAEQYHDKIKAFVHGHCAKNGMPVPEHAIRIVNDEHWEMVVSKFIEITDRQKDIVDNSEKKDDDRKDDIHYKTEQPVLENQEAGRKLRDDDGSEDQSSKPTISKLNMDEFLKSEGVYQVERSAREKQKKIAQESEKKEIEIAQLKHDEATIDIRKDEIKGSGRG